MAREQVKGLRSELITHSLILLTSCVWGSTLWPIIKVFPWSSRLAGLVSQQDPLYPTLKFRSNSTLSPDLTWSHLLGLLREQG